MDDNLIFRLASHEHSIPLRALKIGRVEDRLAEINIRSLGELLSRIAITPGYLNKQTSLEHYEIHAIRNRLSLISNLVDDDGNVDWHAFEATALFDADLSARESSRSISIQLDSSVKLFPAKPVPDGHSFLSALPEIISAFSLMRDSDVDSLILEHRIMKYPEERMTLEWIATSSSSRLTRERVRQRERKLLSALADMLFGFPSRSVKMLPRSEFTEHWRRARDHFPTEGEISLYDFVHGLHVTWDVPHSEVLKNLPLILAVLTSKASLPSGLVSQIRDSSELFVSLPKSIEELHILSLPCAISPSRFEALGISTVGGLWLELREQRLPSSNTKLGRQLRDLTRAIGLSCCALGATFDWTIYCEEMKVIRLSGKSIDSVADALERLSEVVEIAVSSGGFPKNSMSIFRMRISVARTSRPTLQQVAEKLDTYGPCIKRDESLLLHGLNSLLVEGELCGSLLLIDTAHLDSWQRLAKIFSQCGGDFSFFVSMVKDSCPQGQEPSPGSIEAAWSILNRYPGGRNRSRKKLLVSPTSIAALPAGSTIKLRGFRSIH